MDSDSIYINNVCVRICSTERKELIRMAVRKMLLPTVVNNELEVNIFAENTNPYLFKRFSEKSLSGIWNCHFFFISLQ